MKDKFPKLKCVCCERNIPILYEKDAKKQYKTCKTLSQLPNRMMINGGICETISGGYGSDYDGAVFLISICDKCILESLKNKALLLSHDNF